MGSAQFTYTCRFQDSGKLKSVMKHKDIEKKPITQSYKEVYNLLQTGFCKQQH